MKCEDKVAEIALLMLQESLTQPEPNRTALRYCARWL